MSLYEINQNTPEETGSKPIPGNQINLVKFTKVGYEESKEGSGQYVLAFHFKDKAGGTYRHVEWPIDVEETKKRAQAQGDDPNKAVQKRAQSQGVRIKHIITKVIPAERAVIPAANSFEQFAKNVVQLLAPALQAKPVLLWGKFSITRKGYSGFPPYTPFLENFEKDKATTLMFTDREHKENEQYAKAAAARTAGASGSSGASNLDMPGMSNDDDVDSMFGSAPAQTPQPAAQPAPQPAPQPAQTPQPQQQQAAPQQPQADPADDLSDIDDDLPF